MLKKDYQPMVEFIEKNAKFDYEYFILCAHQHSPFNILILDCFRYMLIVEFFLIWKKNRIKQSKIGTTKLFEKR